MVKTKISKWSKNGQIKSLKWSKQTVQNQNDKRIIKTNRSKWSKQCQNYQKLIKKKCQNYQKLIKKTMSKWPKIDQNKVKMTKKFKTNKSKSLIKGSKLPKKLKIDVNQKRKRKKNWIYRIAKHSF